jgi:hypothetical protein
MPTSPSAGICGPANQSLRQSEPVSAMPKRKSENIQQRLAPKWRLVSTEKLQDRGPETQTVRLVEYESKTYQVEVEILENTAMYVHVAVSVDDGSLPASIRPETHSFMCRKPQSGPS